MYYTRRSLFYRRCCLFTLCTSNQTCIGKCGFDMHFWDGLFIVTFMQIYHWLNCFSVFCTSLPRKPALQWQPTQPRVMQFIVHVAVILCRQAAHNAWCCRGVHAFCLFLGRTKMQLRSSIVNSTLSTHPTFVNNLTLTIIDGQRWISTPHAHRHLHNSDTWRIVHNISIAEQIQMYSSRNSNKFMSDRIEASSWVNENISSGSE
jgi:hypothetical protein